jgi:hypothetical protein
VVLHHHQVRDSLVVMVETQHNYHLAVAVVLRRSVVHKQEPLQEMVAVGEQPIYRAVQSHTVVAVEEEHETQSLQAAARPLVVQVAQMISLRQTHHQPIEVLVAVAVAAEQHKTSEETVHLVLLYCVS